MIKKLLLTAIPLLSAVIAPGANGTLCLTFDDIYLSSWLQAMPLFAKYNAHATFFISRKIDGKNVEQLKQLQASGHTIGLHGINHRRAVDYMKKHGAEVYTQNEIMPQLEVCRKNNIKIRAFAYPYSQNSAETDRELFKTFDFLRTNCSAVRKSGVLLAQVDGCFVKNVKSKQLFYGFPSSGNFNMQEVKDAMERAAKENSVLVFYAHDITHKMQPKNHITFSQLESLLQHARKLNMRICGMNELQ